MRPNIVRWLAGLDKKRSRRFHRSFLNLGILEDRSVPSATLMTNGSLSSQAIFGKTPDFSQIVTEAGFGEPYGTITTDIHGDKIDFNKDGYADVVQEFRFVETIGYSSSLSNDPLITFDRTGFIKVALGSPTGLTYMTTGTLQTATGLKYQGVGDTLSVADLDGDGYQDILSLSPASQADNFGTISTQHLYNPATNSFTAQQGDVFGLTSLNPIPTTGAMTLQDVNGDNAPDLVRPRYDTANPVASPNSPLEKIYPLVGFDIYAGKLEASGPFAGQWIGNFEANPTSSVNLRTSSALLGAAFTISSGTLDNYTITRVPVLNTVLADLNNDGKLDLAVPEQDGISVFANPGNGVFPATGVFIQSSGTMANGLNLVAGDFNNDGKIDLATSPNVPSLGLFSNPTTTYRQFDGNIAAISLYTNTSASGGALSFTLSSVDAFNANTGWNGPIQVQDFNGDGNLDIAVSNAAPANLLYGIVEGDGTGQFGTLRVFQGYTNAADAFAVFTRSIGGIFAADIDNNGQWDIVTAAINLGVEGPENGLNNEAAGITAVAFNKTFPNPAVSSSTVILATVGVPYSQQLTVTGGNPSKAFDFVLNPSSVPLPAGLTMSSTGLISGIPTQAGPFQLSIDISQMNGPRGTSLINAQVNSAVPGTLTISPSTLGNGTVGTPYDQQLTASGGSGTISWGVVSGGLPTGLSLSLAGQI